MGASVSARKRAAKDAEHVVARVARIDADANGDLRVAAAAVLKEALEADDVLRAALKAWLKARMAEENFDFVLAVRAFELDDWSATAAEHIYDKFVKTGADKEVTLSRKTWSDVTNALVTRPHPANARPTLFAQAVVEVTKHLLFDVGDYVAERRVAA